MNAPQQAAALSRPTEYLQIPLAAIAPSGSHVQSLRRQRLDPAALQKLADSFKDAGIIEPIIVRPHPAPHDGIDYEIIAGERRYLAASLAGLPTVPALVRELNDGMVLELQLIENLHRDDLAPLEEAEGYKELMAIKGINADQVGELVGQSRSWVYARLKLLDLPPDARAALQRGDMDASRALMVARIRNPKQQQQALAMATAKNWDGEHAQFSVRKLKDELSRRRAIIPLARAPFYVDDTSYFDMVSVVVAGRKIKEPRDLPTCTACPNRSGNCTDGTIDGGDPNLCTDQACFDRKVAQHAERTVAESEKAGRPVITGDAAKAIAPRKDKLVGYVDLDEECGEDYFTEDEPEPDDPKFSSESEFEEALRAWDLRERDHQPRSYNALLASDISMDDITLLQDPKTKAIRRLVPIKLARNVLKKKHDIDLPQWVGAPDRTAAGPSHAESAADRAEAEAKREAKNKAEQELRVRIFKACAAKPSAPIKRAELVEIAEELANRWHVKNALKLVYDKVPEPGQLKDADLGRFIRLARVAEDVDGHWGNASDLHALAKSLKVDPAKIKLEIKAEARAAAKGETPKPTPAKAAPAKKAASKPGKKITRSTHPSHQEITMNTAVTEAPATLMHLAFAIPPLNEGETYLGAIIGPDGHGHHTILLAGDEADLTWKKATDWAKAQGGELPDRVEQALMFKHHADRFKDDVYWSCETHARLGDYAWAQSFSLGGQNDWRNSFELRAVAIRRVII